MVFPEINSLQTAVRQVSHEYLNEAEDYGYSPDICGYVKADVALQLQGGKHPMGRIPKPSLAVLTNACNTYIKWAEIWERMYKIAGLHARRAGLAHAPGTADLARTIRTSRRDRHYVEAPDPRADRACARSSRGRKFDMDRLREVMAARQRDGPAAGSGCSS